MSMSLIDSLYIDLGSPKGELNGCNCEVGDWAANEIDRMRKLLADWCDFAHVTELNNTEGSIWLEALGNMSLIIIEPTPFDYETPLNIKYMGKTPSGYNPLPVFSKWCNSLFVAEHIKSLTYFGDSEKYVIDVDEKHKNTRIGQAIKWAATQSLPNFALFGVDFNFPLREDKVKHKTVNELEEVIDRLITYFRRNDGSSFPTRNAFNKTMSEADAPQEVKDYLYEDEIIDSLGEYESSDFDESRNGLSFEAHESLGYNLYNIRNFLLETETMLINAYGTKVPCKKITDNIDILRSWLDDKVCAEYPEKTDKEVCDAYYGHGKSAK